MRPVMSLLAVLTVARTFLPKGLMDWGVQKVAAFTTPPTIIEPSRMTKAMQHRRAKRQRIDIAMHESSEASQEVSTVVEINQEEVERKGKRTSAPDGIRPAKKQKPPPAPKPVRDRSRLLIVALGNPGDQYKMTRHNIGFLVGEELDRRWGANLKSQSRFEGVYGSAMVSGKSVGLLKPSTFMNRSGQAARKVCDFFEVEPYNVLVLTDDLALDFGALRLRTQGGAGGHNGLKSMESHLKTKEYPRLRIGIGSPSRSMVDFVLGEFSRAEKKELDWLVSEAANNVEMWIMEDDTQKVMTAVNQKRTD